MYPIASLFLFFTSFTVIGFPFFATSSMLPNVCQYPNKPIIETTIRTKDLVAILELGASTIEKVIAKLKEDKVVEREGSTKKGLWKIIEQK